MLSLLTGGTLFRLKENTVPHTPTSMKRNISVINDLRQHPQTRDVYATVDGELYSEYLQWHKQWETICNNPILFEECAIGGDRFELEFTFMPAEPVKRLIEMYLTTTCHWKDIVFGSDENGTLLLTIGA